MDVVTVAYESGPVFELARADAERELERLRDRLDTVGSARERARLERHVAALERALRP